MRRGRRQDARTRALSNCYRRVCCCRSSAEKLTNSWLQSWGPREADAGPAPPFLEELCDDARAKLGPAPLQKMRPLSPASLLPPCTALGRASAGIHSHVVQWHVVETATSQHHRERKGTATPSAVARILASHPAVPPSLLRHLSKEEGCSQSSYVPK